MTIIPRHAYQRERVITPITGKSMTKQSFKDECNINTIMDKYRKTGIMTHVRGGEPRYGDFNGIQYKDALDLITKAQSTFANLPSNIRREFDNDPAKFMDFVNDEKNIDKMVEMGLAVKTAPISSGDGEGGTEKQKATKTEDQGAEKDTLEGQEKAKEE